MQQLNHGSLTLIWFICLKCHYMYMYDENCIFSIEAIIKHKQVACMRRKMLLTFYKYLFLFQRYSSFWNMQISQVMTSYTQPNVGQIRWKEISQPICIRNVWFLAVNSTNCAPQFERNSFVTMATYWVPDLPNIKGNFGHLWRSIFIFANGASYTWSNEHINMLAWVCGLVYGFSSWKCFTYWDQVGGDWKRQSCQGNKMFYSHRCVFCRIISLPNFNGLGCKLAKITVFIYLI